MKITYNALPIQDHIKKVALLPGYNLSGTSFFLGRNNFRLTKDFCLLSTLSVRWIDTYKNTVIKGEVDFFYGLEKEILWPIRDCRLMERDLAIDRGSLPVEIVFSNNINEKFKYLALEKCN